MANECSASSICKLMFMLINVHLTVMIVSTSFDNNSRSGSSNYQFISALEINHYNSHPDYYYKTLEPQPNYRRHHKTAYEMNMNDLQQHQEQQSISTSAQETSSKRFPSNDHLPQEQKLALQIFITDPSNGRRKTSGVQHKKHSNILIGKKRPYDVIQQAEQDTIVSNNHHNLKKFSPSERHFYMLSPVRQQTSAPPVETNGSNITTTSNETDLAGDSASASNGNRTGSSFNDTTKNDLEPPLLKVLASNDQRETSLSRKPITSNHKIELVRTQHRPPWRKKPPSQSFLLLLPMKTPNSPTLTSNKTSTNTTTSTTTTPAPTFSLATTPRSFDSEPESFRLDGSDGLSGRRIQLKSKTTPLPISSKSTTEFYKLISSAHSPVETVTEGLNYIPSTRRRINGKPFGSNSMNYHDSYDNFQNHQKLSAATRNRIHELMAGSGSERATTTTTTAPTATIQTRYKPSSSITTSTNNLNMSDGHVISPEILVGSSNEDMRDLEKRGNLVRFNGINRNSGNVVDELVYQHQHNSRPALNFTLNSDEIPSTVFDGKRKVTIIRHSSNKFAPPPPTIITTRTTTEPLITTLQFLQQQDNHQVPNRIKIEDSVVNNTLPTNLNQSSSHLVLPANQLVRMISKHKNKYDDNVKSHTLTVVDNDAIRLPPNATSVHNKLIVAIRPGRPRRYPSTTQFPVYNIVAGITPPSIPIITNQSHTQSPFVRPNSPEGSVFGLLKPTSSETTTTQSPQQSFGAQNIKFPAQLPSQLQPTTIEHVEIQDKLNISVPDSANTVGPHKIPDKILMETEEHHERPPDALVISDATIVSRPYGSNTVINQDGIMKLGSTTRKPTRHYTTKRINIVASNTTVVHQFNHPTHNQNAMRPPPPTKPSFLAYLGNIFNAGIATSALAVLTLIKTIFTIILVMFLPPIALTAAITQAIALG